MTRAPRRTVRSAALAGAAALLLAGCGGLQPGTAASVEGREIPMSQVDDTATVLCTLSEEQIKAQGTPVPLVNFRRQALAGQVLEEAARTIAAERDLEVQPPYDEVLSQQRATIEQLPEDQRGTFEEVVRSETYTGAVLEELGSEADAAGQPQAQQQAGLEVVVGWLQEADIEIAPQFDMAVGEQGLVRQEAGTSTPVGEFATGLAQDQPDPAVTGSLPPSQVCG